MQTQALQVTLKIYYNRNGSLTLQQSLEWLAS
jgi:hypothetical protein